MKFPFPFKATAEVAATTTTSAPSWPWRSCAVSPQTLSFRAYTNNNSIYKTINSAYLDDKTTPEFASATPDSFFTFCNSSEDHHEDLILSFESEPSNLDDQLESAVVSGLRSDRMFFEPGKTNSILEEAKTHESSGLHTESVEIKVIDSFDPLLDFRASMEEMVEAHGLKSWACLEELLHCYLRVNDARNHGYVTEAFMDMLINLDFITASTNDEKCCCSSTTQRSFTSPLSFSSSSAFSSTSPGLSSSLSCND